MKCYAVSKSINITLLMTYWFSRQIRCHIGMQLGNIRQVAEIQFNIERQKMRDWKEQGNLLRPYVFSCRDGTADV